jgi:hypothetical protein
VAGIMTIINSIFLTYITLSFRKNKRQVALKLQKSAPHYTEAAMDEIEFLDKVLVVFDPVFFE